MAAIIKECGYKLEQWRKPLNRSIRRIEKQLDQTIKAKSIAKQAKKPQDAINQLTSRIIRLKNRIKTQRDKIKSREVYATIRIFFAFPLMVKTQKKRRWISYFGPRGRVAGRWSIKLKMKPTVKL